MPETFLTLSASDRRDALGTAATRSGRAAYLLEKDIWVVWTLDVLFRQTFGQHLVFKGGTSLSKAYDDLIQRFSEDIDLTYDIRQLIPDKAIGEGEPLPTTKSQEKSWSKAVREQLPKWLDLTVLPVLQTALGEAGLEAELKMDGDKIELHYTAVTESRDYVRPMVLLEFGARSTGEPAEIRQVDCYAAAFLDLEFPVASPRVMRAERTFWEKATAAHVFCQQAKTPERYARHWHDLVRLDEGGIADSAIIERSLARQVAEHKQIFFESKASDGSVIQYEQSISGQLHIVPAGQGMEHLEADYKAMVAEGLLDGTPLVFSALMERCQALQEKVNAAMKD